MIEHFDLATAVDRLKNGDVIAMPTETVYGLAGSVASESALKKIFALKERPFFDPLIVHVASFEQAKSVVREFSPLADFLARQFWPGPLTLVLPKAAHINSLITSGLDTVAVRYPAHPLAQELIRRTGQPLAAPSANKFGRTSPSTAAHVRAEFDEESLIIIDGGECAVGLESTVVSFGVVSFGVVSSGIDEIRILRPGGITAEDMRLALARWSHPVKITRAESHESPGHLKHHYMPAVPLAIVRGPPTTDDLAMIATDLRTAVLKKAMELELTDDPVQGARRLYSEMRRLSELGADLLYVVDSPARHAGLWEAIWDRLARAASWTAQRHRSL